MSRSEDEYVLPRWLVQALRLEGGPLLWAQAVRAAAATAAAISVQRGAQPPSVLAGPPTTPAGLPPTFR